MTKFVDDRVLVEFLISGNLHIRELCHYLDQNYYTIEQSKDFGYITSIIKDLIKKVLNEVEQNDFEIFILLEHLYRLRGYQHRNSS